MERSYVFATTQEKQEWQRLTAIEREFDPSTRCILEELGVREGWACLEIGPGAGSIVNYLCNRVGKQGHVVAVDVNPRFVENIEAPNLKVLCTDITNADLPSEHFDLVHARYVVLHIKEYREALANMVRVLKPGGWFFLEEPDFTLSTTASHDTPSEKAVNRVFEAIVALYSSMGIEPAIGRKLPRLLQQMDLDQVHIKGSLHLSPGGSNMAKMMQMSIHHLEQNIVETEIASKQDVDQFTNCTNDKNFWAIYYGTVQTYGKKQR